MTVEELNIKLSDKIEYYQKLVDREKDLMPKTANYKDYVSTLDLLKAFKVILANEKLSTNTFLKLIESELETIERRLIL